MQKENSPQWLSVVTKTLWVEQTSLKTDEQKIVEYKHYTFDMSVASIWSRRLMLTEHLETLTPSGLPQI
jgi:hypothetical protein